jgi:uncharacterized protein (DUF2147 family)
MPGRRVGTKFTANPIRKAAQEALMKKLFVLAALLMATTAAHAGGISFEIEGQRVRIEAPRNCSSLSCISITAPGFKGLKSKRFDDDDDAGYRDDRRDDRNYRDDRASRDDRNDRPYRDDAPRTKYAPAPAQAAAPQAVAPAAAPAAPAADSTTVASTAPVQSDVAAPTPAPVTAAQAPQPAPVATAPVSDPNSPLGVWATEENKGNVSIEQCGDNLCGYAVKTGEKILISMKPTGSKWSGRIHDPDSGRNYDSTMAMKGSNTLRVQGCAFGGMFCGGQTWKRVS